MNHNDKKWIIPKTLRHIGRLKLPAGTTTWSLINYTSMKSNRRLQNVTMVNTKSPKVNRLGKSIYWTVKASCWILPGKDFNGAACCWLECGHEQPITGWYFPAAGSQLYKWFITMQKAPASEPGITFSAADIPALLSCHFFDLSIEACVKQHIVTVAITSLNT